MKHLMTRWGKSLDKTNVLQEYPRPSLVRDSYLNLNGEWDYCINQQKTTEEYTGKILVPFSPETDLSGVAQIVQPEDYLHYRKRFSLPEGFVKERVLLHFGAVDQECEVFLNQTKLGEHKGGYLPFSFDINNRKLELVKRLYLNCQDICYTKRNIRIQLYCLSPDTNIFFYLFDNGITLINCPKVKHRATEIIKNF